MGTVAGGLRLYRAEVLGQRLYDVLVWDRRDHFHLRRILLSWGNCWLLDGLAKGVEPIEALRVEKIQKNFGGLQVLRDISFTLEQGGPRLVIIGPNGAGKTTLFNLITGELTPSSGKVYLFSRDVTRMQCHRRTHLGLGRTFQIVDLFFDFTVMENILLALEAHETSCFHMIRPLTSYKKMHDKARKLLEGFGLWEKRDFLIRALSHGEMRHVELILGLAMEPKILLLDEPTAGLTSSESERLAHLIQNLSRDITLAMIEHDMKVAFALAERMIVLHNGEILADEEPEKIRANPNVKKVYLGERARK